MAQSHETDRFFDRVVILFLCALFALVSPLKAWWAGLGNPWYAPYLLWLLLIVLALLLQRRMRRHVL